jgi:thiamine biosynthesis lipoprotein
MLSNLPFSPFRDCVVIGGKAILVILNPSPFVTLSEAKGLVRRLRINSVKNLIESIGWKKEILRLMPQNDITTPSLNKGGFIYVSILFFCILAAYPPSSHSANVFKYHQVAMGTVVEITLIGDDEEAARKAALQAFQEIRRIEYLMSPWIESSDINRINRSAGNDGVKVSPETIEVLKRAQEVSKLSEGGFDITVGPLVQLWRKAREGGMPPEMEEVKETLHLVNFRNLKTSYGGKVLLKKKGMAIDLGGIAKGYAVDRAFELLKGLGYRSFLVNAGGDLRVEGSKSDGPWSIGIQHPRDPEKMMARISISNTAVATSGDYEKFFIHQGKRYHHILNPKNGFPAEGCQSVTVLHKEGVTADALATAIFVLGPEKGYSLCQRLEGVDCLVVDKEGNVTLSPRLKGRISSVP